ncbi:MAG: thymidylate synthase [Firmicutes bacterium]|nr:thymidylate synthase [Bacillota bacterium]
MKEILVEGRFLSEAYHNALMALHTNGEVISCNDWDQKQKEVSMTMVVAEPLSEPMVSKLYIGGFRELQQYVMEVLDGILDFKIGEDTCWEYTYHDRMVNFPIRNGNINQVEFVVNELRRSTDSRRAVINIRDNGVDPFNPNPACLQNMQFFIRGEKLHCKVLMRSNDATKATFMNAFAFIMLQKKIADALGVGVGTYTHRANSFHCYEKDFPLLQQYIDGIKESGGDLEAVTYEYEGFFKDIMEESIPEIEAAVNAIRDGSNS